MTNVGVAHGRSNIATASDGRSAGHWCFAIVACALLGFYAFEVVRTAWISDDAQITVRTILNLVNGLGPVFNVGERVQGYTHPLWFLLLAALQFVVADLYTAVFVASVTLSLAAFAILLFGVGVAPGATVVAALALVLSKSFVDYSTSGLENPLAHFVLAVFVWSTCTRERLSGPELTRSALAFSAIVLTRHDLAVLALPAMLAAVARAESWATALRATLLGSIPFVVWESFSLVYYGALVPNTALAKLNTLATAEQNVVQGVYYFADSLRGDPVTLAVIGCAVGLGLVVRQSYSTTPLAAGVLLYLVYVLAIGGDFMSGRFFAAPLFVGACIVALSPRMPAAITTVAVSGLVFLGLFVRSGFFQSLGPDHRNAHIPASGIADERGYYAGGSSLYARTLPPLTRATWAERLRIQAPREVGRGCSLMGKVGIERGPHVHLIDECALFDPLLARIPAQAGQRIGHFRRPVPAGYEESIRRSRVALENPYLRRLYEPIWLVTRGELFSPERWRAIVELNTGRLTHFGRYYGLLEAKAEGSPWDAPGTVRLADPITLRLEGMLDEPTRIDVSADNNDEYRIQFEKRGEVVAAMSVGPRAIGGLARYVEPLPREAIARGFDSVTVSVVSGDGVAVLGHVLLE